VVVAVPCAVVVGAALVVVGAALVVVGAAVVVVVGAGGLVVVVVVGAGAGSEDDGGGGITVTVVVLSGPVIVTVCEVCGGSFGRVTWTGLVLLWPSVSAKITATSTAAAAPTTLKTSAVRLYHGSPAGTAA
jgi:hypothetical protein